MNETLATMMAGISHLDKEAREAHRLRLLLDDVVLWLRSVNIQDINNDAWVRLRDKVAPYHRVEVTPGMCGLPPQSDRGTERGI